VCGTADVKCVGECADELSMTTHLELGSSCEFVTSVRLNDKYIAADKV
jgi:hypothetical protein